MNESRPGVTSRVLQPDQAVAYLSHTLEKHPDIAVAGIAGPGDPFANSAETMETLRLIRARHPHMLLCVASNGLGISPYFDELATLKVSHVTVTINALDPEIGGQIYAWVRDNKKPLRGTEAASCLIGRQLEAVKELSARGVVVKVNSIIIPGINSDHIPEIAKCVAGLGATIMNAMPLEPVEGSGFGHLPRPDGLMISSVRLQSGQHLRQMTHCARCRADAAGKIGEELSADQMRTLADFAAFRPGKEGAAARTRIGVISMEGALVNQHLGEAGRVLIYEKGENGVPKFVELRRTPSPGNGDARWKELGDMLSDCSHLLVGACGPSPRKILEKEGLTIVEMEGLIEEGLEAVLNGKPIPPPMRREFSGCGAGVTCRGTGTGCG